MIALTIAEIAEIVGGSLADIDPADAARTRITGTVEFDSRAVTPGGLFLALPGARTDGHDHAAAAVAAGAAAVLAARPVGVPAIVVPPVTPDAGAHGTASVLEHDRDGSGSAVLAALAKLAAAVAARLVAGGLTIVGVTGSSGKTSTKDLLAAVLSPLGKVIAPPGSFNNELGHPWTVLRATEDTDYLVLEMSARHPGNIAALAAIAPPQIAVVLNVGTAHLGEFGSRQAIADTKSELPQAVPSTGVVVLNADDSAVAAMAAKTAARVVRVSRNRPAGARRAGSSAPGSALTPEPGGSVVGGPLTRGTTPLDESAPGGSVVGGPLTRGTTPLDESEPGGSVVGGPLTRGTTPLDESAEVWASDVVLDDLARARFVLHHGDDAVAVTLAVFGDHQVSNALCAAAVALECGATLDQVAAALAAATPASPARMAVVTRGDGVTVINDAYNANPDSMRAGLQALAWMAREHRGWAVLGEMAELGDDTISEHDRIGRLAVRLDVSRLVVVGTGRAASAMHQGAVMEGSWGAEATRVDDADAALALLRAELRPGDVVLVKASNSAGLGRLAQALIDDPAKDQGR